MKAFIAEGSSFHSRMLEHSDATYRMLAENILKNKWFLKFDSNLVRDIILNENNAFFFKSFESEKYLWRRCIYFGGHFVYISYDNHSKKKLCFEEQN